MKTKASRRPRCRRRRSARPWSSSGRRRRCCSRRRRVLRHDGLELRGDVAQGRALELGVDGDLPLAVLVLDDAGAVRSATSPRPSPARSPEGWPPAAAPRAPGWRGRARSGARGCPSRPCPRAAWPPRHRRWRAAAAWPAPRRRCPMSAARARSILMPAARAWAGSPPRARPRCRGARAAARRCARPPGTCARSGPDDAHHDGVPVAQALDEGRVHEVDAGGTSAGGEQRARLLLDGLDAALALVLVHREHAQARLVHVAVGPTMV